MSQFVGIEIAIARRRIGEQLDADIRGIAKDAQSRIVAATENALRLLRHHVPEATWSLDASSLVPQFVAEFNAAFPIDSSVPTDLQPTENT
jgi:hypothetical protein